MPNHGQPITLTINSLTEKGDGIADWHGRKVFIPARFLCLYTGSNLNMHRQN